MSEENSAPQSTEGQAPVEGQQEQKQASPPVPAKKKYTYKADGQEFSEELDDNEVQSRLSLSKAAQARMKEAAATKQQSDAILKALRENPLSVLNNDQIMGQKKFREIAEGFLAEQLKREMMSPEEIKRMEMEEELNRYKEQEKRQKEEEESKQAAALEEKYAAQYQKTIIDALESSALPKNPFTISRMATLMQKNLQHGLDLEPQQLAQLVKEDFINEQKALIGSASAEQLIAMFGEEVANKIRKYDLSKFKIPPSSKPIEHNNKDEIPEKRMSPREYTEFLKNKFK